MIIVFFDKRFLEYLEYLVQNLPFLAQKSTKFRRFASSIIVIKAGVSVPERFLSTSICVNRIDQMTGNTHLTEVGEILEKNILSFFLIYRWVGDMCAKLSICYYIKLYGPVQNCT